ncbi:hypothetical protein BBJ28_00009532 [Nothophytophthora sp. Chile5]|nr:hypothetical protein BBJ28_00009532 [Nothophytophthora sp. Chile5]
MTPTTSSKGRKKRRRSESFHSEKETQQQASDDPRERLAAFHARMFEPQPVDANAASSREEMPVLQWKGSAALDKKSKKHKKRAAAVLEEEGEPVPLVKFKQAKKKEKKAKQANVLSVGLDTKRMVQKAVTRPGMPSVGVSGWKSGKTDVAQEQVIINGKQSKKLKRQSKKQSAVAVGTANSKTRTSTQAPQWHSMAQDAKDEDEGEDPLEQAMVSVQKELLTEKTTKPKHKKHKRRDRTASEAEQDAAAAEEPSVSRKEGNKVASEVAAGGAGASDVAQKAVAPVEPSVSLSKTQQKKSKKRKKKKEATLKAQETSQAVTEEASSTVPEVSADAVTAIEAASSKTPSRKKPKKKRNKQAATMPTGLSTPSLTAQQIDEAATQASPPVTATAKLPAQSPKKAATAVKSPLPETPLAISLAEDAKKDTDMFVSATRPARPSPPSTRRKAAAAASTKPSSIVRIADESSSESEGDAGVDGSDEEDETSLFSRLIDSAARERWELLEVGRLVRLFAAQWGFRPSKTARFLRETCPELVSVDFLEGLGVHLSAKQLVGVFERGSGNSGVLMNKLASAVENGHVSVRDPDFVSALERRIARIETNAEVLELLHPLLESMSTVRDVGCLLRQLCEHWQLERTAALVQQVLLTNVFDDLDGNQDELLRDLPLLKGRLDFPSRLDQEDADENGNLAGFLANEDSDLGGEDEESDAELDESDSDEEEEPYEGETDSEEEAEMVNRSRGRSRFIEDEADVGEEDEELEEEHDDDEMRPEDSSSSDSDDEDSGRKARRAKVLGGKKYTH